MRPRRESSIQAKDGRVARNLGPTHVRWQVIAMCPTSSTPASWLALVCGADGETFRSFSSIRQSSGPELLHDR
jgi:hypothetical protein